MGIRLFLEVIDAPVLAVQEEHHRTRGDGLHIKLRRHTIAYVVLYAIVEPSVTEWLEHQMLKALIRNRLKESMLEAFLAVLVSGIDFQAFLRLAAACSAMRTYASLLVDAAIVSWLIELHVDGTLPFPAALIEISRRIGISGLEISTWHEDASLVIKQIQ